MNQNIKIKFISWNVRGLNERKKRLAVRETFLLEKPDLVCLQETKLEKIDQRMIREICGLRLLKYEAIKSQGTRGGIIIAWTPTKFTLMQSDERAYSLSLLLKNNVDGTRFWFSGIYGPSTSQGRTMFYEELSAIRPNDSTPWIIGGDLNITLGFEDRNNNTQVEMRTTLNFASLISSLGLINTTLHGRRFTWSSERQQPHMARLDRFLISTE
jgi:exonuclease III